ncbi:MAG: alpha/beta fold hydrolase [Planctomycetota bacterium]|nr:alpha/beta fold hydrolase [Planctomycetota bacterium]MDG2144054.1 alpha/beta fold hydrolase [Planctomycetota bacterium]
MSANLFFQRFFAAALLVGACLLLLAAGSQDPKPPSASKQKKLVDEYLKLDGWLVEDATRRREILSELAAVPPLTERTRKSWLKRFEKSGTKGPGLEKSSGRHYFWPDEKKGLYIIGGKTKKPKGLLIAMHGGGKGSGDAGPAASSWSGAAKDHDLLLIAPEVIEKTEHGWTDAGTEEFVVQLIERAIRTFEIDPGRVYLAGHSMGGYGTWTLGGHHADRVAGLTPSAGAPTPIMAIGGGFQGIVEGIIPNLYNVPIRIYQSDDDVQVPPEANRAAAKQLEAAQKAYGGFDFEYWEVSGRGHTAPPGGYEALFAKVADRRRVSRPTRIVWQPELDWKLDFYWLRWRDASKRAILTADLDRQKNSIEIMVKGGGQEGLSVWLDEQMVDLEKEVTILLSGKEVYRGIPLMKLTTLLESAGRGDTEYLFPVRVDLD